MPVEVAQAMLNEEKEKKESFENVPSLMTDEIPRAEAQNTVIEAAANSEGDTMEGVNTDDLFF